MSEEKKEFFSLRTKNDLIAAHERIVNGLMTGDIDAQKASAISRLLRGSQFLITELPYKKLMLMVKLQANKIDVPNKFLAGYLEGENE